jgi:hypothetical protein
MVNSIGHFVFLAKPYSPVRRSLGEGGSTARRNAVRRKRTERMGAARWTVKVAAATDRAGVRESIGRPTNQFFGAQVPCLDFAI